MIRYGAVAHNGTNDIRPIRNLLDPQLNQPVIDEDTVIRLYLFRKVGIGYAAYRFVAENIARRQRKLLPFAQHNGINAEIFEPNFRSLGIQHNGDRQVQFLSNLFDTVDTDLMLFVRAVRKIQAAHIQAFLKQFAQHLFRVGSRTDGTDNLCLFHISSYRI